MRVEHGAERARREHVDVFSEHGFRRRPRRALNSSRTRIDGVGAHVRDAQLHAFRGEQAAEVIADAADALNRDAQARRDPSGPGGISRRP